MSFRIEEKIILNFGNIHDFKLWLKSKKAKKIYPKRNILSVYFDNLKNNMFIESEEGIVPRKKIRIRYYPNANSKYLLEEKTSSVEGRFKTSKKISNTEYKNFLYKGINDKIYGLCFPKVIVNYDREYYLLNKSRVTIDQNIKYSYFKKTHHFIRENNLVVEIKENINLNKETKDFFPFQRKRFSKYCRAISELSIYQNNIL